MSTTARTSKGTAPGNRHLEFRRSVVSTLHRHGHRKCAQQEATTMFRDLADLPPAIAATTPTESDIGWNTQVTHDGPMYLCDECALKPDGRVYALMLLDLELADPSPWVLQCGRCRFTETIERES